MLSLSENIAKKVLGGMHFWLTLYMKLWAISTFQSAVLDLIASGFSQCLRAVRGS